MSSQVLRAFLVHTDAVHRLNGGGLRAIVRCLRYSRPLLKGSLQEEVYMTESLEGVILQYCTEQFVQGSPLGGACDTDEAGACGLI